MFGGYWRRMCRCGNTIDRGQGDPPLEDLEEISE
jgi:hypothetical protein